MAKKLAVVAVGGNSLILDPKKLTVEDQHEAAAATSKHIADMIEAGWDVAIGHGNGPQVGLSCAAPRLPRNTKECTKFRWMSVARIARELSVTRSSRLYRMS